MWFELKGDQRLQRCATDSCGGQPIWRFESGGIGSDYCSGCKATIERMKTDNQHCRAVFAENVKYGDMP